MKVIDILGTKKQTLENLKKLVKKSEIEEIFSFTVREWKERKKTILALIEAKFDKKIIIRSSTLTEDSTKESQAGQFDTLLNVEPNKAKSSIEKVISSYDGNEDNEVLIQNMSEIQTSGVIFTRNRKNAPYYVINYDDTTSKTDTVTSGTEGKRIEIIRNIDITSLNHPWYNLIESVREIEDLISLPLDIEFGIDWDGNVIIFQVRPLIMEFGEGLDLDIFKEVEDISESFKFGEIYSDMSFWNPAEMIGDRPNRLAYSLYRYLITESIWNSALIEMGYTPVKGELMVEFGGKPYIDVVKSFHTLLPYTLQGEIRDKLIDYCKQKLYSHPELHDKIEFEVVPNCHHHCFEDVSEELSNAGFSSVEVQIIEKQFEELTTNIIENKDNWFKVAEADIIHMSQKRKNYLEPNLENIKNLLEDCKNYGIDNFTRMARLAFISKILVESMVNKGWLTSSEKDKYLSSIKTVASHYDGSETYGHLREGTYDITSPRYDQREDIKPTDRILKRVSTGKIPDILRANRFLISRSIKLREQCKFEFTKNLSLVLEHIATIGKELGFTREELSHLDIETILSSDRKDVKEFWSSLIRGRKNKKIIQNKLSLPPIIFFKDDFKIVPYHVSKPNFITEKSVRGEIALTSEDIREKIVLIENADPGYDWIFSKKILGLITCYGGVASHMAIRCAEFGIPAVIGCGKAHFEKVKNKKNVYINCKEEKLL